MTVKNKKHIDGLQVIVLTPSTICADFKDIQPVNRMWESKESGRPEIEICDECLNRTKYKKNCKKCKGKGYVVK